MAEVGRERRQEPLNIDAAAIPVTHCLDGEGVAQVVEARPASACAANRAKPDQPQENAMEILVDHARAGARNEETGGTTAWTQTVAKPSVLMKRGHGRRLEWQLPGLAELAVIHPDQRAMPVDVLLVERECFADAHASGREQPDQCRVGRTRQSAPQTACTLQQADDLLVGIDVWGLTDGSVGQEIGRRDLGARVVGVMVPRELAERFEVE